MRAFLAALIASALGGGCYRPSVEACQLQCNNQQCPSGLTCNEQGFCASSASAVCDSLPVDAPADADDSAVTVEVLDRTGAALPSAVVVFADRSNTLIDEKVTGPDGIASSVVPPGGSATAIRSGVGAGGGNVLYATTYLDVWPGAHLVAQSEVNTLTRQVHVTWQPMDTANQYEIRTSCGTPPINVPGGLFELDIPVPVHCPTFDVIVHAGPASSTNPPSLAAALGGQTASSVVMPMFQQPVPVMATIAGRPTNAAMLGVSLAGWITPMVPATAPFTSTSLTQANPTITLYAPKGVNLTAQVFIGNADPALANYGQVVIERLPAMATSYTRNLNGIVIPWVGNATYEPASRSLRWQISTPQGVTVATPNVVMADVGFTRGMNRVSWRVIAPGSYVTTSVEGGVTVARLALPDIPGDRVFEPMTGDVIDLDDAITVHVDDAAVHGVIEQFEAKRLELSSSVPGLGHLTFMATPQSTP
jgi:hypothetical protein